MYFIVRNCGSISRHKQRPGLENKLMANRLILILALISGNIVYAQQDDCKVLKPEISGSYTGDCKNGMAQGKGVAQGKDQYEGAFDKGLPSGKGTYKWADGTYYEGHWENGVRDGSGKMVYKDSTVTGFWKNDVYVGKKLVPPYEIMHSMSVSRSTFIKSPGGLPGVRIRLLQGGSDNRNISDFAISYSSGEEYRTGAVYGIEKVQFPLYVRVRYDSWNQFHTVQFTVIFEFTINDPGLWDVNITT
jgi:hypothetical protein